MSVWGQRKQFVIRWLRLGEWYEFRQTVSAGSKEEAREVAASRVKEALGSNHEQWTILAIEAASDDRELETVGETKA